MAAAIEGQFHCDVTESQDEHGRPMSLVHCHGRLVAGQAEPLRAAVQPLLRAGGRTVIDCSDLGYIDSVGLGVLVALKVSSLHKGSCRLEFVNLSPRVKELLRITKLTEYLAQADTINYGG